MLDTEEMTSVHTAETILVVCNLPRSQGLQVSKKFPQCVAHRRDDLCGVRIEIFTCLWLLLMGHSGEILLGVNTTIMKEKT